MTPANPDNPFGDPGNTGGTVIRPMPGRQPGPNPTQPGAPFMQPGAPIQQQPGPPMQQAPQQPMYAPQQQGPAIPNPGYGGMQQPGMPQPDQAQRGLAGYAAAAASLPAEVADIARASTNPLVAAAVPLLGFVARLRNVAGAVDINPVRERVYEELRAVAGAGRNAGVPPDQLRAAHYALCATVDDVVMNTPWGAHSGWNKRTMVNAFHGDVEGGERFYMHLETMLSAPAANRGVLELMYCSLALGFEGRYRLHPRGHAEHSRVRENLYNTLRGLIGSQERELSPEWRGVTAPARSGRKGLPLWVLAAAAAVFALGVYAALMFALGARSEAVESRLGALGQYPVVQFARVALPAPPQPAPPPPVPAPPPAPDIRLLELLAPEVRAGRVTLDDNGRRVSIIINYVDMFDTGKANIKPDMASLLRRIGEELRNHPGSVVVTGHTDNVPIRTLQFPSNLQLSQARATNAAQIIIDNIGDPSRVTSRGRADTEPRADNATPEGKARNRRVEVVFTRSGAPVQVVVPAGQAPAGQPPAGQAPLTGTRQGG
jgi:type VI secretion system protein ImpK